MKANTALWAEGTVAHILVLLVKLTALEALAGPGRYPNPAE